MPAPPRSLPPSCYAGPTADPAGITAALGPAPLSRCTSGRALLRINGIAAAIRSGRRKGRAHSGISGHRAGGKQRLHSSPYLWLLYHKQGEAAPQKGRMKGPQTPGGGARCQLSLPASAPSSGAKKGGSAPAAHRRCRPALRRPGGRREVDFLFSGANRGERPQAGRLSCI